MLHTHCFFDLILQTKWTHKLSLDEVVNNDKLTKLCVPHWRIKTNEELRHKMKQENIVKIYKITKIKMGSSSNENGENKNHQKNNKMDSI
jgi:hypothetical protein